MTQVVQARCPHCQNVLRIPADWVSKSMRCKHCQKTFQAKGKSSTATTANVMVAAPAPKVQAAAPVVAQPSAAPPPPPAAAPPASSSSNPFGFDGDDAPAPAAATPPKQRKKKGKGLLLLVLTFFFLFVLGASGAGIFVYKVIHAPIGNSRGISKGDGKTEYVAAVPADRANPDKDKAQSNKDNSSSANEDGTKKDKETPKKKTFIPPSKKDKKDGKKPVSTGGSDPFPRRALLISVNNYLMFSDVHYGSKRGEFSPAYPGSSTAVLREQLSRLPMNFPPSQVYELSDAIPSDIKTAKAHPTQKSVIETTIKDFVESSREQDRIVVFFAGHGCYLDEEKKSFLIPIDGNLKNPASLVPLRWVYDQLAKSKAQQKVLILDVFRFSPSRGFELPSPGEGDEGVMPEGFDKDVLNPPAGLQVWCACQKEQSSVELEGGSAFLQALCHSLQGGTAMTGISEPSQPIPFEALVDSVNKRLKELVTPEKRTQVSRLTGKTGEVTVAFSGKEPMPARFELKPPTAQGAEAAGFAFVNNLLGDIVPLPPVRATRIGDFSLLKAENLPAFSAKKLEGYKSDKSLTELEKSFKTDKSFGEQFPLRAAYFEALDALRKSSKITSRELLSKADTEPKRKALILQEQAPIGMSIFHLEQALASVKSYGEMREKETSPRWQANYDYTVARMQSRLVYLIELNYTLGQIRADNLPDLAPGQSGWRIGTGKKIAVTESKAKNYAKDTKKLWDRIQNQYPDTPWALLAQRESMIALGLEWRPKSD